MEMGVSRGVHNREIEEQERERRREREHHVSFLSCALLSPRHTDTPQTQAIITELLAIIRCHFCPSEVFPLRHSCFL